MTEDPLPISLIAHTAFCPRRAWLESVGERVESAAINSGIVAHRRVDARADERTLQRRSVEVSHEGLGVVGRCDVVDVIDGGVRVVEFKSAPLRGGSEVTRPQRVQLALQGLCLSDMGEHVIGHAVHFTTARRTVEVVVDSEAEKEAREFVERTRELVNADVAPLPLVDDPRCGRCSHVGVCLPDEFASHPPKRSKRVNASDPHGETLHLTVPGSRANVSKGRLVVKVGGDQLASLPVERVSSVVIHGNVDVSSGLMRELLWRDVPVLWASYRGHVVGYARSTRSSNAEARRRLPELPRESALQIARELIASKIANQATQMRRSTRVTLSEEVGRMRMLARRANAAPDIRHLFGLEGEAASIYFRNLQLMLNSKARADYAGDWPGRVGRGALDPLNVALNVVYGALLADVIKAIIATGLDAHVGLLHSSKRNKPALALDLMEQFRPVVADSVVIGAINNGELRRSMFVDVMGSARLSDVGRRALLAAYERRLAQSFKHPTFGYSVSWRRAMEVQARAVLAVVDGTLGEYRGIRMR